MNRFILLVGAMLSMNAVSAQDDSGERTSRVPAKHSLKMNVLQIVSFYPTIPLQYEVRLAPSHSLQFEGGYVFSVEGSEMYANKRGSKWRAAWRWYMPYGSRSADAADYFALEPYLNNVDFDRLTSVSDCSSGNCVETQYYRVIRYRESGAALKFGHVIYGKFLMVDLTVGLRIRNIRYDNDLPNNNITLFRIPSINENDRLTGGFVLGLSFGWHSK